MKIRDLVGKISDLYSKEASVGEKTLITVLDAYLYYYILSSVIDILFTCGLGWDILGGLVSFVVVPFSFLVFLLVLLPRVPKMFILPPLIYILAAIVFSLPVYVVSELDNSISTLFLAGGQFIIGMLTLLLIKIRCGKFYLQVKDLKSTTFSKGYLLKAFAGTVISIIAFICITLAVLMLGIKYYSSGFIKVSPNSIELAQKTFEKGDKQVILCGMSHIGKKKFYDQLKTSFPSEGAIILSEGISDSQELLKKRSHYKRMADSFDLTTQPARFSPTIVHRNADIDISEFSPEALKLLKYVMNFHASIDKKDGSLLKNWMIMNEKMSQYSEKEIFQMVKKDFIKKRNKHLLKEISEALLEYNIAIVPWGVAHMPDLEQTLEEQGFTCKEVKYSSLLN